MTSPAEGETPGRREIAFVFAVALAVAVALFPRALFGGATFFHYDTWLQNLTFRAWWFEQLRAGHFATWCPGMFAGYPLFAETQTGPLYPPVFVLFSLLPATLAFSWSVALHLVLGGAGAYLLARRFGAAPAAAALAGVAFESSGFLVTHVVHFNLLIGAAWMPWIPWLVTRTFDGSRAAPIALAAVLAGLLLGAHPYATLMALALAAWTFVHRAGRSPAAWTGGASAILAAGLLAVALAAVQVLPTREFLPQTTRGEAVSWDFLTFGSWEPWRIVTLVAPDRVGTPVDDTFWGGPDWSHFAETCAYVGTATLALAAVALVLVPSRATWPAILAAISFVLMLGRFTPAYRVLTWLPLFQSTRLPSRFALPFTLALAILAAIGLDALIRESDPRRRRRALLVGGILIVGLGALAWMAGAPPRSPGEMAGVGRMWSQRIATLSAQAAAVDARIVVTTIVSLLSLLPFAVRRRPGALLAAIPVVVVAIELISWGRTFNPVVPAPFVTDAPPAVAALPDVAPRPRIFRQGVDEMWERGPAGARTDLVTPGWRGHERTYESGAWTLPPNSQLLYDVDSGEGFTSLLPLDWLDWMGLARQPGATPRPDLSEAQADLLAIDAVVSTGSGIGGEGWETRALPGDVYLSRNLDPLPRVRLARSWRTQPLA
ncbi:MAG: hypothetical protein KC591_12430, partial [Gemmatimonadetes bacterium]|nr:hypothetical protein [Gemmatimonadota bacterium]